MLLIEQLFDESFMKYNEDLNGYYFLKSPLLP